MYMSNPGHKKMIFRSGLLVVVLTSSVVGDLPVHCELTDVLGDWRLTYGRDPIDSPGICKPDSGMNPLNIGALSTVVSLTRMFDRSSVSSSDVVLPFVAYNGLTSQGGSWSTIYDEGVVVQIKDQSGSDRLVFYGHFGFSLLDTPAKTGAAAIAPSPRGPAVSYCNIIPRGWVLRISPSGGVSVHCFSATRVSRLLPPESRDAPITPPTSLRLVVPDKLPNSYRIPNWDFPRQSASASQGSCGSCYVLSYAYALERVAVNRLKQFGINPPSPFWELDRDAILACSVANQGCSGGFYSSLTLDLVHLGAPVGKCMQPSSALSGTAPACDLQCYADTNKLIFTRGYTELRTHDEIIYYLLNSGPVPVGIYMASEHHNALRGSVGGGIIELPTIPLSPGMDKLNHGIVIVGWGTDETSSKPFWEIYNPWGGDDTFAKVSRNPADGVAERNAIGIKVDTCRGLLGSKIREAGKESPRDCN